MGVSVVAEEGVLAPGLEVLTVGIVGYRNERYRQSWVARRKCDVVAGSLDVLTGHLERHTDVGADATQPLESVYYVVKTIDTSAFLVGGSGHFVERDAGGYLRPRDFVFHPQDADSVGDDDDVFAAVEQVVDDGREVPSQERLAVAAKVDLADRRVAVEDLVDKFYGHVWRALLGYLLLTRAEPAVGVAAVCASNAQYFWQHVVQYSSPGAFSRFFR